jgi:hypothetical protein
MRFSLVALAAITTLSVVPAPAAASSGCGGPWGNYAICSFACDDVNLYVFGWAQFPGAVASVTVTAECGIAAGGLFVPLYSVSCTATGPSPIPCQATGPNTAYPAPLAGRCTVTGYLAGMYGCVSAP